MSESSLEERVDSHFSSVGLASMDSDGMMRHILDCLGALKFQMKNNSAVAPHLTSVFRSAVNVFLDQIQDNGNVDPQSAVIHLTDSFPDPKKRRDGRGWLPLHWASSVDITGEDDMKNLVRERPLAAGRRDKSDSKKEMMDDVISYQEVVGSANGTGLLPIHFLCSLRHPRIDNFRRLVAVNVETARVSDFKGWLPLHWCASNCSNVDILRYLLELFPRACLIPTRRGQLPFQCAQSNRNTDVMNALLEVNPDAIEAIDNHGNNSIHDAARYLNPNNISRLLALKPDLALTKNFKEQLPIHKMFSYTGDNKRLQWHQMETLRVLMEQHPMTIAMPDRDGKLPLHLATYFNCSYDLIKTVYEHYPSGALIKDGEDNLPVEYARDPRTRRLLMGSSPSLTSVGITTSFARFVA